MHLKISFLCVLKQLTTSKKQTQLQNYSAYFIIIYFWKEGGGGCFLKARVPKFETFPSYPQ